MRPIFNLTKINPGDWMIKIDLKDAYFAVSIAPKDQKFLKFRWLGQRYQFRVLPFGLGSAPKVFMKLLKPVLAILRSAGVHCAIHLDDLIVLRQSQTLLIQQKSTVLWLFQRLGFQINWDKSLLIPQQILELLGFIINSLKMTPALPADKLKKIQESCQELIVSRVTTVRKLAKVIGKLTAAVKALLPAPLHYRHLQRQKNKGLLQGKLSYETVITLGNECVEEQRWWVKSIIQWNGRSMIRPIPDWELTITTDASKSGWGPSVRMW